MGRCSCGRRIMERGRISIEVFWFADAHIGVSLSVCGTLLPSYRYFPKSFLLFDDCLARGVAAEVPGEGSHR
jgi:hypothetical protein